MCELESGYGLVVYARSTIHENGSGHIASCFIDSCVSRALVDGRRVRWECWGPARGVSAGFRALVLTIFLHGEPLAEVYSKPVDH